MFISSGVQHARSGHILTEIAYVRGDMPSTRGERTKRMAADGTFQVCRRFSSGRGRAETHAERPCRWTVQPATGNLLTSREPAPADVSLRHETGEQIDAAWSLPGYRPRSPNMTAQVSRGLRKANGAFCLRITASPMKSAPSADRCLRASWLLDRA
jgi:hypothetical protein